MPSVDIRGSTACMLPDHPELHAQVPASGSHYQEEGAHGLPAQFQVGGVPHLRLCRNRLHRSHRVPEPVGESPPPLALFTRNLRT